ncbi:MAG TPA: universal stress protein [Gaiellaceae bacterium]|nr:universal stress protein [Gaiellaceae bacterium]
MTVANRDRTIAPTDAGPSGARPIMLVTFDVPVEPQAAELAVDAAVESGQPLVVVNVVDMPIRPMTASWGQEVVVTEDVDDSLRAPAELARSLAVAVERIRLVSPRPLTALLELVSERRPGLLVVGPDRSRIGRWRLRRAERKICRSAPCLVWTGADLDER